MTIGSQTTIHDLVWKTMSERFQVVKIKQRIKDVPPVTHDDELEMEY